jgi:hypothetical protein
MASITLSCSLTNLSISFPFQLYVKTEGMEEWMTFMLCKPPLPESFQKNINFKLMSGSSHIQSVLIGVEYKLLLNFGCLSNFFYLDGANSIKTDLHICNLWTGQFVCYKSVVYF